MIGVERAELSIIGNGLKEICLEVTPRDNEVSLLIASKPQTMQSPPTQPTNILTFCISRTLSRSIALHQINSTCRYLPALTLLEIIKAHHSFPRAPHALLGSLYIKGASFSVHDDCKQPAYHQRIQWKEEQFCSWWINEPRGTARSRLTWKGLTSM